jgi:hypothetical protein
MSPEATDMFQDSWDFVVQILRAIKVITALPYVAHKPEPYGSSGPIMYHI